MKTGRTEYLAGTGPCIYMLYPNDFDVSDYTFPNYLCIFPDGRTKLNDATFGGMYMDL